MSQRKTHYGMIAVGAAGLLILAGMTVVAVIAIFLWFGRNSLAVVPKPLTTSTPTATNTFASIPTLTPTTARTYTPFPTSTATPPPAWATNFAEPILSAIANQPPKIQDDMNDNTGGWRCRKWSNNPSMEFIEGELVLNTCAASRSNMAFTDFVLELDERFLPGATRNGNFRIFFRDQTDGGIPLAYKFFIHYDGSLSIFLPPYDKEKFEFTSKSIHPGNGSNHITVIAKGRQFAFYINGQPLYYLEDGTISQRGSISFETYSNVALDNLKIWDISDLP